MDNLDEIIKKQMISSYENNAAFRNQIIHTFNSHYIQNIKYHLMWLFFHSFSFAYPEIPSEEYKIETANFISNIIPKNLGGCGGCQNDYKIYIEKLNVFRIVSSKQEISTFFVDLHNYITKNNFDKQNRNLTNFTITINEKLVSPTYCNYADIELVYKQTDFIPLLESKFNINMFKLIENKSLASFYDIFNKFDFKTAGQYNVSVEII
jgi:hypothetical protein